MRIYIDTSVFGLYPPEAMHQEQAAMSLFNLIRSGQWQMMTSEIVEAEIARAPEQVRGLYNELFENALYLGLRDEVEDLADAYISEGIVTPNHYNDALHVAFATVSQCDVLTSWDVRELVNTAKIAGYHAVSIQYGYPANRHLHAGNSAQNLREPVGRVKR